MTDFTSNSTIKKAIIESISSVCNENPDFLNAVRDEVEKIRQTREKMYDLGVIKRSTTKKTVVLADRIDSLLGLGLGSGYVPRLSRVTESHMDPNDVYESAAEEIADEPEDVKPRKSFLVRLMATKEYSQSAGKPTPVQAKTPNVGSVPPSVRAQNVISPTKDVKPTISKTPARTPHKKLDPARTPHKPCESARTPHKPITPAILHHYQLPTESSARCATPVREPTQHARSTPFKSSESVEEPEKPEIVDKAADKFKKDLKRVISKTKKMAGETSEMNKCSLAAAKKAQQMQEKAEKARIKREEKERQVRARKEESEREKQRKAAERRAREERAEQFRQEQLRLENGVKTPPRRVLNRSPSRSPARAVPTAYKTPVRKVLDYEEKCAPSPSPGRIPAKHMRLEGLLGSSKEPTVALSPSRFQTSTRKTSMKDKSSQDEQRAKLEREEAEKEEQKRLIEEQAKYLMDQMKEEERKKKELELEEEKKRKKEQEQKKKEEEEAKEKERRRIAKEELEAKNALEEAILAKELENEQQDKENAERKVSYDMTPDRVYKAKNANDYGLDLNSDDETDDEEAPRKEIPAWAEMTKVRRIAKTQALSLKQDMTLFFGMIPVPDVTLVFGPTAKIRKRGSSAVWKSPLLGNTKLKPKQFKRL